MDGCAVSALFPAQQGVVHSEQTEEVRDETERNQQRQGIAWQFTSLDARCKLKRLYQVKACSSV